MQPTKSDKESPAALLNLDAGDGDDGQSWEFAFKRSKK
jgi:hypothetical protein